MRKRLVSLGIGAALVLTATVSGTAQAATSARSGSITCHTYGATGDMEYDGWSVGTRSTIDLGLSVVDTNADGNHVRIRFVSKYYSGDVHYWGWRSWTGGSGAGQAWYTTAQDSAGMYAIGIQVARFEGSTMLNSKTCWV
jgi:hypothetical protein